jgi:Fe-S-cluster-containing hydrogenase component 2
MIAVDERFCPKNHACPTVHVCPTGAITQSDTRSAPRVDHELCTECGLCTQSCRVFVQVEDPARALAGAR